MCERIVAALLSKQLSGLGHWAVRFKKDKSKCLMFSRRPTTDITVHFGDSTLDFTSLHKYLRVWRIARSRYLTVLLRFVLRPSDLIFSLYCNALAQFLFTQMAQHQQTLGRCGSAPAFFFAQQWYVSNAPIGLGFSLTAELCSS
jgi:hypothetical protein